MTSDSEPVSEDDSAPYANRETDINASNANPSTAPTGSSFHPTKPHCEITCQIRKDGWDKVKPWFEGGGVIILLVYTIFTGFMYCANKKAANAAETAANAAKDAVTASKDIEHRQLRAYITFGNGLISKAGKVVVNLINVGQTPAYETRSWWTYTFMPDPTPFIHDQENNFLNCRFEVGVLKVLTLDVGGNGTTYRLQDRDFHDPIGKGSDCGTSVHYQNETLTPTEVVAGLNNGQTLFVWGVVKYRDFLQLCQYIGFIANSAPNSNGTWTLNPYYNVSSDHYRCTFKAPFGDSDKFDWYRPNNLPNPPTD